MINDPVSHSLYTALAYLLCRALY